MPVLATTLVSLTIQESPITAFVQTPVTVLAVLRELFVDLSVQPARGFPLERLDYAVTCVRCPGVVLFAIARASAVGVGPHTVVRLGYTLGLRKARPALILAGCTWSTPSSFDGKRTQLKQLFSDVDEAETTAVALPEYYDTCRCSDPSL